MELQEGEMKDRQKKIKKRHKYCHKPIITSKDNMDKFVEQEMKKISPIIRNWFDWLMKQNVIGKKSKTIRNKLRDKTINDIWELFEIEKQKENRKKRSKTKKIK